MTLDYKTDDDLRLQDWSMTVDYSELVQISYNIYIYQL